MLLNVQHALLRAQRCAECKANGAYAWYAREHRRLGRLAKVNGRTLEAICAVMALTSANTMIGQNRDLTARWAAGETIAHFADILERIALVEEGDIATALTFGRGERGKIASFAHNLQYPYDAGVVTLDRHAWSILLQGVSSPSVDVWRYRRPWPQGYGLGERTYVLAGEEWNLRGHEAQALVWVHRIRCQGKRWERRALPEGIA